MYHQIYRFQITPTKKHGMGKYFTLEYFCYLGLHTARTMITKMVLIVLYYGPIFSKGKNELFEVFTYLIYIKPFMLKNVTQMEVNTPQICEKFSSNCAMFSKGNFSFFHDEIWV